MNTPIFRCYNCIYYLNITLMGLKKERIQSEQGKMSKEKRVKERAAWRELKIVIHNYRALGFDYLIRRPSQQNVCFGSTIEREPCTLQNNKMNAFMRRIVLRPSGHVRKSSSPISKKVLPISVDKKNSAIFESAVPRFIYKTSSAKLFSPNDALRPTKINSVQSRKSRRKMMVNFVTPCPGTYNIDYKRKYTYYDSFGGKKLPIPATKTLCIPNPITVCDKCETLVKGDFWQKISPLTTYCKCCMSNEKNKAKYVIKKKNLKFKKLAELDSFDRTQDCTFNHRHGGTTASVKLLPKREVLKRFRWEHYLSQFSL